MHKIHYILFIFVSILFTKCKVSNDEFKPSSGNIDFSKFVSIGDSYCAGYTNGALGKKGQLESFAYILSERIKTTSKSSFVQPLVQSEGSIGSTLIDENTYSSYLSLQLKNKELQPLPSIGNMAIWGERVYSSELPIQNLGVPGAKVSHILAPEYAKLNPYFARFASSLTTSIMDDALAIKPTFISLWVGINDVLSFALKGGEDDYITPNDDFNNYLNVLVHNLYSNGTQGAIANIPNINDFPYFNLILSKGHIPFIIEDRNESTGIRQLLDGEKVLLSASSLLQKGFGQAANKPIPQEFILDSDEINAINSAIETYNKAIKNIANEYNLAFVDIYTLLNEAATNGVFVDGNKYTNEYISGGIYSLDGINPTGKGSAIIANKFIESMNLHYNSNIPLSVVNNFNGIIFP